MEQLGESVGSEGGRGTVIREVLHIKCMWITDKNSLKGITACETFADPSSFSTGLWILPFGGGLDWQRVSKTNVKFLLDT